METNPSVPKCILSIVAWKSHSALQLNILPKLNLCTSFYLPVLVFLVDGIPVMHKYKL